MKVEIALGEVKGIVVEVKETVKVEEAGEEWFNEQQEQRVVTIEQRINSSMEPKKY